ncbi:MAG: hypothetical protein JWL81_594 [Verrucomicrobiales bacterium]|nr:hypothetical protein [Verrucomicrobiales bacterium]
MQPSRHVNSHGMVSWQVDVRQRFRRFCRSRQSRTVCVSCSRCVAGRWPAGPAGLAKLLWKSMNPLPGLGFVYPIGPVETFQDCAAIVEGIERFVIWMPACQKFETQRFHQRMVTGIRQSAFPETVVLNFCNNPVGMPSLGSPRFHEPQCRTRRQRKHCQQHGLRGFHPVRYGCPINPLSVRTASVNGTSPPRLPGRRPWWPIPRRWSCGRD